MNQSTIAEALSAAEREAVLEYTSGCFVLPDHSPHGPDHWHRVRRNGLLLAGATGANRRVIELFAFFHDSCRETDGWDIEHGPKGAELALAYHAEGLLPASDAELDLLVIACRGHTVERTHADATIATCWDADRLDLPRVGIKVDPQYLCTDAARDPVVIREAEGRAVVG
ncbi:hypothetical protein FPL11_04540 [Spiribacter aquaticus]|uniref:HD domain-containing protein n=1 Tax=Spiribacter aquaticus TaxID=1935996 RepID=A0A557RJM7_9GAMM|nr:MULTISPECIES: hypothetical protein [Spiribacter]TVO65357.1 hypothetical protein FPL11_04540 [Spiribacter aquaticus]